MDRMKKWMGQNIVAILLVLTFIPIFIITQVNGKAVEWIGTTSSEYLNHEYYRWMTCVFFHYNFVHIFFNSLALLCIGSLLSPFLGKWKTLLIFVFGGAIAEIPFSLIVHYGEASYGGGSSGGIFALISAFLVCYLRFPEAFQIKWYRPDLLIVFLFFIFANDDQFSFLTHVFGFVTGILLSTIMVMAKWIKRENPKNTKAIG